jgi:hypothetical protein
MICTARSHWCAYRCIAGCPLVPCAAAVAAPTQGPACFTQKAPSAAGTAAVSSLSGPQHAPARQDAGKTTLEFLSFAKRAEEVLADRQ